MHRLLFALTLAAAMVLIAGCRPDGETSLTQQVAIRASNSKPLRVVSVELSAIDPGTAYPGNDNGLDLYGNSTARD